MLVQKKKKEKPNNNEKILTPNTTDVSLSCTPSDTRTVSTCLALVSLSMGFRTRTLPVCRSNDNGDSSSSSIVVYVSVEFKSGSVALSVATSEPIGISSEILYSIGTLGHVGRLSFLSKTFTFTCVIRTKR